MGHGGSPPPPRAFPHLKYSDVKSQHSVLSQDSVETAHFGRLGLGLQVVILSIVQDER